ncbi:MAG: chemotaxis protein CheW [Pseudomonadota bacterium]
MDDLLPDFLSETQENLQQVDDDLLRFEQSPADAAILDNIFRLVHTVKGSCGFIGLPRLEKLAHAAESLLGRLRDGEIEADAAIVSETLAAIDAVRGIVEVLATTGAEPEGDDDDLIARLDALTRGRTIEDAGNRGKANVERDPDTRSSVPSQTTSQATSQTATQESLTATSSPTPPSASPAAPQADSTSAQTIRVSVDLLEELMVSVSELVLTRNQLIQDRRGRDRQQNGAADKDIDLPLQRLSTQIGRLQDSVMRTRMQPISGAWAILPRMVRQLAIDLDKAFDLETVGGDTELDRQMLEQIKDPLAHMVRNAADHGLEPNAVRRANGKPSMGKIRLVAAQEGGHITLTLSDDGAGLDLAKLREKAISGGHMTTAQAEEASDAQLARLIFAPGMSTAKEVTQISGRGVGMDVVRANIEKIGGTIEVESVAGRGTTFRIRIPLTLAIMPALIVGIKNGDATEQAEDDDGSYRFAVPQIAVAELVRATGDSEHRIEYVGGAPVLRLRGQLLPLMFLQETLGVGAPDGDHILIIRGAGRQFGIVVDGVFDTEELVVKPLGGPLARLNIYSGNAILGDGQVVMILDANGLAEHCIDVGDAKPDEDSAPEAALEDTDAMLLFRAGGSAQPRAVPLALVSRIEDIAAERIEPTEDGAVVQLRDRLVPLVALDGDYTPPSEGRQSALVFAQNEGAIALAVDQVLDIVDAAVKLELSSSDPSKLGTAVIAEQATELLDVAHLLSRHVEGGRRQLADGPTARILVVDDSPFFRNMLKPLLSAAGYRVTVVDGVEAALALREEGKEFDLILSDIEMPGRTGLDFARAVRADGNWSETPLIALSSLADEEDMDAGMAAGFDRYVAKFDRQRLLALLADSVDGRRERAA